MRNRPPLLHVSKSSIDLLDDVQFVLDVLERSVVVELLDESASGLLRAHTGHSCTGKRGLGGVMTPYPV